jgi:hypothetical protein
MDERLKQAQETAKAAGVKAKTAATARAAKLKEQEKAARETVKKSLAKS